MSLPIKETPVLTGQDARRFEARMRQPKRVSEAEYRRARKVYEELHPKMEGI